MNEIVLHEAIGCLRVVLMGVCLLGVALPATGEDGLMFSAEQLMLPGKRGACFTLRAPGSRRGGTWEENLPKLATLQPYWNYSWGADWVPPQKDVIDSEFLPMIWGAPKSADDLKKVFAEKIVPRIKDGTVKRVMGFNEPDKKDQAGMPYMEAIALWPLFMELGVPLVSPACANPEGINDPSAQGYTSALFFEDGSLTALGRYYASVTKENPAGDQSIEPDNAEAHLAKAQAAPKKHAAH